MLPSRLALRLVLAVALAATCFVFTACDEDEEATTGSIRGTVMRLPGEFLLEGVEVALLDASDMTVARTPVLTNAEGAFSFRELEPGRYYVFAYSAPDLILDQTSAKAVVVKGQRATHNIRLLESELWDATGNHIEGVVVDAESSEPIAGAYASSLFQSVFTVSGLVTPYEAVTDAEGRFRVQGTLETDETGELIMLSPIVVTKEGYVPYVLRGISLNPDRPDTTVEATIEMSRLGDEEGVLVQGVVVDPEEEPIAGLRVILSVFDLPAMNAQARKTPMLGYTATTGADGSFRFDNVPSGFYYAHPGADTDDGWVPGPALGREFLVRDEDVVLGEIVAYPSFDIISPTPGEHLDMLPVTLSWAPVDSADFYQVIFGFGHLLDNFLVEEPELTVPVEASRAVFGFGRWLVEAYDSSENYLGETETFYSFTLEGPDPVN